MLERDIVAAIKKYLSSLGSDVFFWKEHGGPYGCSGVPDVICCYKGRFIGLECKLPGGRLETLDTSGNTLGMSSYNFTVTVPAGVTPNLESVTVAPVNSNSVLAGWNAYAYGKSQAKITINGASGAYGSTIKSYSITTDPSVGSANASNLTTGTLYKTGTVTITAKVTDSRGRTATQSATFSVSAYAAPVISGVTLYRCKSDGTRDDVAGTYAYVKANFSCSVIGSNKVSVQAVLSQIGGSYTTSPMLTSGSRVILGGGKLAVDATYSVTITAADTVGSVSTYSGEVSSAAYIMHVKKGGRALGFGMAAGADGTASFGWPLILSKPLAVAQGGTGANTASGACSAIGAVKKSGDTMSGNLNISTSLYPSICLLPSYNSTTNRTIFEGSYIGASSFSSWEDSTGNNRRMLEIRAATPPAIWIRWRTDTKRRRYQIPAVCYQFLQQKNWRRSPSRPTPPVRQTRIPAWPAARLWFPCFPRWGWEPPPYWRHSPFAA